METRHEAWGNLNLAISISAKDKKEMEKMIQKLHSMNVVMESITLRTCDGTLIAVEVHNWEIEWETIEEVQDIRKQTA